MTFHLLPSPALAGFTRLLEIHAGVGMPDPGLGSGTEEGVARGEETGSLLTRAEAGFVAAWPGGGMRGGLSLPLWAWAVSMGHWRWVVEGGAWSSRPGMGMDPDGMGPVDGRPDRMVVIDEFGYYSGAGFASLMSMARSSRKHGFGAALVTQNLGDFTMDSLGAAIFSMAAAGRGGESRRRDAAEACHLAGLVRTLALSTVGTPLSPHGGAGVPPAGRSALLREMAGEAMASGGAGLFEAVMEHMAYRSGMCFEWLCAMAANGDDRAAGALGDGLWPDEAVAHAHSVILGAAAHDGKHGVCSSV